MLHTFGHPVAICCYMLQHAGSNLKTVKLLVQYGNTLTNLALNNVSKMAADLCGYKLALVASFKIKYAFEF